jgi:hypothetical protein
MTILMNQEHDRYSQYAPVLVSNPALETTPAYPARVVRVRLEKLATGCWSVQAAAGTRGGLFRDHASATKFIKREFAARQLTLVETLGHDQT